MSTERTGKCYTCGRPIWMDEYYRWRHNAPDEWIDARYVPSGGDDHPLCEPAHTYDKKGKKVYL
jgi:hypothetical protein